ncbi:MAG: zinc metallopeptidase [Deltaproteobacteria bacterium]|nr:zinc metallopeptidase [Deltaproteobacteria bacterium]MBW2018655.1 zinc metallopeptidase [Deltaproteobacteria bacterium]MBW2073384.1 zinc metallopeptidase [Deltaproteobacteria bacterium]RLB83939.1 MAG: zinc metallopeptidase [Deltaproteobacteria bacterium]
MRSKKKIIAVQPLGRVKADVLEVIAANLQAFFQIRTEVFLEQPIPDEAYNAHRCQYNCYPILKFLETLKPDHVIKIIGVTEVDLFIPILTYVFGEAELGGDATVISTYRAARGKDQEPVSLKRLFERAAKIAVHEMAHTFRLPHCKEDRCIMSSFPVLSHIDEKPIYFCRYCVRFLKDEYETLGLQGPGCKI